MMRMIAVVAMAENRVIGDGKGLIWHIPNDLKRVKTLTMACPLIMGRKTWDSIGRPLPGRASIVMTRDRSWTADGAITVSNLEAAIEAARSWIENTVGSRSDVILFGGGEIYRQGLEYCHRVERTVVAKSWTEAKKPLTFLNYLRQIGTLRLKLRLWQLMMSLHTDMNVR
ncbi:MAG: dihydrofolate reductase [Candidatus Puniceispirillaceae bacterium]